MICNKPIEKTKLWILYLYIYINKISVCVCVCVSECAFNIFIFTIHKYFKKINSKGLLEVAIENWLKWDFNPQPLKFIAF